MIKFSENNKVENIGILTEDEAKAYISFLDEERDRHGWNIAGAEQSIDAICIWPTNKKYDKAIELFWQSAIRRHKGDICEIDVLVEAIRHFHRLNNA